MTTLLPGDIPPEQWEQMKEMAKIVASTGMYTERTGRDTVPLTPPKILTLFCYGRELNIGRIQALSGIDLLFGKPALSASLLRSLAERVGHIVIREHTDERATVAFRCFGDSEFTPITKTIEDARRNEWTKSPQWQKQPGTMLIWRAFAEAARFMGAELGGSPVYIKDELDGETTDADVAEMGEIAEELTVGDIPEIPDESETIVIQEDGPTQWKLAVQGDQVVNEVTGEAINRSKLTAQVKSNVADLYGLTGAKASDTISDLKASAGCSDKEGDNIPLPALVQMFNESRDKVRAARSK